jgi:hypothetical protein
MDFSNYSWDKWFESLDLSELQALSNSWWKVIQYAEGMSCTSCGGTSSSYTGLYLSGRVPR